MDSIVQTHEDVLQRCSMKCKQTCSEEGYESASHASTSSLASLSASRGRLQQASNQGEKAAAELAEEKSVALARTTAVPVIRTISSGAAVNIAVRNEQGLPDFVDIDTADDEEEDTGDILPLEHIVRRIGSSERIRSVVQPASRSSLCNGVADCADESDCLVCKIRHQSIAERVLKRRNSEHALQQAMQVAQSRKETLARLLLEHQQIVKEVEKWSSVVSPQERSVNNAS